MYLVFISSRWDSKLNYYRLLNCKFWLEINWQKNFKSYLWWYVPFCFLWIVLCLCNSFMQLIFMFTSSIYAIMRLLSFRSIYRILIQVVRVFQKNFRIFQGSKIHLHVSGCSSARYISLKYIQKQVRRKLKLIWQPNENLNFLWN